MYDFEELVDYICEQTAVRAIVLFPETGEEIERLLSDRGWSGEMLVTRSMEDAVQWVYYQTDAGRACLLSCASPSYSIRKNFEEKGALFASAARAMDG